MRKCLNLLFALAVFTGGITRGEDLPDPKTGGPGGKPLRILVISDQVNEWKGGEHHRGDIDARYRKELEDRGYQVTSVSYFKKLSVKYLKQFGVVILTKLPPVGNEYSVYGFRLAHLEDNLQWLREVSVQPIRLGAGV